MTWTRLEPGFPEHPKILAAGERAELLHIHGLIYCNKYLTDGFIPTLAVRGLLHSHRRPVERLVELGIWVKVENGYQVHDFLDFQMSKAEVVALKEERAVSGRLGGLAKARALAKQKSSKPPSEQPSKAQANGLAVPFRSVPSGSLDPVRDNALSVGTGLKSPTNGEMQPLSVSLAKMAKVVHQ